MMIVCKAICFTAIDNLTCCAVGIVLVCKSVNETVIPKLSQLEEIPSSIAYTTK